MRMGGANQFSEMSNEATKKKQLFNAVILYQPRATNPKSA